jgi:DNA-binding NtrC family response regulator
VEVAHLQAHVGASAQASPGDAAGASAAQGEGVYVPVGSTVEQAEKSLILITLAHTKNNKTRAAEILGISLKTLFNKLKEYGSSEPESASS